MQVSANMAESLRAQIATPRQAASSDEQQQLAQHRRYANILSQSRARRVVGGPLGSTEAPPVTSSTEEGATGTGGLFSPPPLSPPAEAATRPTSLPQN